ncbi:MAG: hypothetical protein AAFV49_23345, partial [Pseudomonadota bacterium]
GHGAVADLAVPEHAEALVSPTPTLEYAKAYYKNERRSSETSACSGTARSATALSRFERCCRLSR